MSTPLTRFDQLLSAHRSLQIAVILVLWLLGEALVRALHLPLPAAIAGMVVLLALLAMGRVQLASIKAGADWLLAEMLLFFVPAVLAIRDHRELLGWTGLKVLLIIVIGTAAVMAVTALVVEMGARWLHGDERGCADGC